jgi:WbqC-like protein family
MKVAIMQPYFVPYIGYFQLINYVDLFVVYDNIEYTKKGWFARNRILQSGESEMISLPIAKGPDDAFVVNRRLADSFHQKDKIKLKNKLQENYRKAPFFKETMQVVEEIWDCPATNLFDFIYSSLCITTKHLSINTPIKISSEIDIDHNLRAEQKVLAICENLGATAYVNPIGGVELYSAETFQQKNIELKFLKANNFGYAQFSGHDYVPFLSILDIMMFNDLEQIKHYLNHEFILQ